VRPQLGQAGAFLYVALRLVLTDVRLDLAVGRDGTADALGVVPQQLGGMGSAGAVSRVLEVVALDLQ
jgi:hypothetical protein